MSTGLHAAREHSLNSRFTPIHGAMLQRKCACGGSSGLTGSCSACEKKKLVGGQPLQTKLAINEPGDMYEQEADRIADQVMATPATPLLAHAATYPALLWATTWADGCGACECRPGSCSPGRPLEPALQQDMEQRFGHDFGQVRVHSDTDAEQSARDLNAKAYTLGTISCLVRVNLPPRCLMDGD